MKKERGNISKYLLKIILLHKLRINKWKQKMETKSIFCIKDAENSFEALMSLLQDERDKVSSANRIGTFDEKLEYCFLSSHHVKNEYDIDLTDFEMLKSWAESSYLDVGKPFHQSDGPLGCINIGKSKLDPSLNSYFFFARVTNTQFDETIIEK
jgi:hypothetical protein